MHLMFTGYFEIQTDGRKAGFLKGSMGLTPHLWRDTLYLWASLLIQFRVSWMAAISQTLSGMMSCETPGTRWRMESITLIASETTLRTSISKTIHVNCVEVPLYPNSFLRLSMLSVVSPWLFTFYITEYFMFQTFWVKSIGNPDWR